MECLTCSDSLKISYPATLPSPEVGEMIRHSIRRVVDLPALRSRNPNIHPFD